MSEIIFRPYKEIVLPQSLQNNMGFPAIPSAYYYYGDKIPVINDIGTDYEKFMSAQIWYAMKSDIIFPLLTVYAKSRDDQIGVNNNNMPGSQISLSIKGKVRQIFDMSGWLYYDRFQLLLGQIKGQTIEDLIGDFYRFPLHPSADPFMVARLLEPYIKDGNEEELRRYLEDRGIIHLENHPFGYYPIYPLFFLLTRFASYPMSEEQIQLSNRRLRTSRRSPERIFIDAIFHYEIHDIGKILEIIDQIEQNGSESVGIVFGTNNPKWVNWANEYLTNFGKPATKIDLLRDITAEKLNTWTDFQIQSLCDSIKLKTPFPSQYPTRYTYVTDIAVKIRRFKVSPSDVELWKRQVVESDGY